MTEPLIVSLPTPEDTDRLGSIFARAFAKHAPAIMESGLALRLEGDLGAGKTSLMRAALRELGWTGPVKSPTFTLLETYRTGAVSVNHFDFYRFEEPEEFMDAGFLDCFSEGAVCATEWSEKAAPYLPPADITVELQHDGLGRRAVITANEASVTGARVFDEVAELWTPTVAG